MPEEQINITIDATQTPDDENNMVVKKSKKRRVRPKIVTTPWHDKVTENLHDQ